MITREKLEGNYVLNESKIWITHAPMADVFVVQAKDNNVDLRGFVL
jgi:alkylation response protein AidB-like acyl-CoA dehydrogenase